MKSDYLIEDSHSPTRTSSINITQEHNLTPGMRQKFWGFSFNKLTVSMF